MPRVQVRQFLQKPRRLQGVKPEISANASVEVFGLHSVVANPRNFFRKTFIVCDDHTAVAKASQIFCREKAQAPAKPESTRLHAFSGRAYRLRAVFDYGNAMAVCNFHNRVHVCALPEGVDGHYRLCPRSYGFFKAFG